MQGQTPHIWKNTFFNNAKIKYISYFLLITIIIINENMLCIYLHFERKRKDLFKTWDSFNSLCNVLLGAPFDLNKLECGKPAPIPIPTTAPTQKNTKAKSSKKNQS